MKMYLLTIGLNDKNTKTQIISDSDARKIIFDTCGDSTIEETWGCYTHIDGTKILEKSMRVGMLFKDKKDVLNMVEPLKQKLNQESIVFEEREVESVLM